MSTPIAPRPADDSRLTTIAWAVATIVVALAAAFVAWLALGDRDGGTTATPPPATSSPSLTAGSPGGTAAPTGTSAPSGTSAGGTTTSDPTASSASPSDQVRPTTPPEVAKIMLDQQRRDPRDPMAVGRVDAPVVMIEYADYRCPYCAKFARETRPALQDLVDDGTLRIEFRDLVLFEEQSHLAAVAARAAAAQGHLTDFQHEVFALSAQGHGTVTRSILIDIAKKVGVKDIAAFTRDLRSTKLAAQVDRDTREAQGLGLRSTPTFLINTTPLEGAYPAEQVRRVIEDELARAQQQG